MSATDHGGPAFPVPLNQGETYSGHAPADGMTLRDYFAAKAMAALIAGDWTGSAGEAELWAPGKAYEVADAMLAARGAQ